MAFVLRNIFTRSHAIARTSCTIQQNLLQPKLHYSVRNVSKTSPLSQQISNNYFSLLTNQYVNHFGKNGYCSINSIIQPWHTMSRGLHTSQTLKVPTLNQIRRKKVKTKRKYPKPKMAPEKRILFGPQRKGICVKCVVRTPRKPNSAKRKCAVLRLNNGKLITAYIPGERANLQEHGVVLFRGGRVQDCPGIKYKIIRGKFDIN